MNGYDRAYEASALTSSETEDRHVHSWRYLAFLNFLAGHGVWSQLCEFQQDISQKPAGVEVDEMIDLIRQKIMKGENVERDYPKGEQIH